MDGTILRRNETSLGLRLSDEWISRRPKPNSMACLWYGLVKDQTALFSYHFQCISGAVWGRVLLVHDMVAPTQLLRIELSKPTLWMTHKPTSRRRLAARTRHLPTQNEHFVMKLSLMTRVCCTDEVSTWLSRESFRTPTGT